MNTTEDLNLEKETQTEEGREQAQQPENELGEQVSNEAAPDDIVSQAGANNEEETDVKSDDPKGVVKRINKITAEKRQAIADRDALAQRLADLEAQISYQEQGYSKVGPAPRIDDFEDAREYLKAKEEHQAKLHAYEEVRQQEMSRYAYATNLHKNFSKQRQVAMEKYEDFAEVVDDEDNPFSPVMAEAIQSSAYGAEIAYYLAKNRALAEKIYSLNPVQTILEIGKLETKFVKAPPKVQTQAHKPTPSLGSGGAAISARVTMDDLKKAQTLDEYKALKKRYDAQK